MATSNEDRVKGTIDTIKGKAKKIAGVVTNNQKLQNEGSMDQLKGKMEKGKATVKDSITKTINKT